MAIERIRNVFADPLDPRFKLLIGSGTNDIFINSENIELKLEEALYEELINNQYECVVFYSPHKTLFFFDEISAQYGRVSNSGSNESNFLKANEPALIKGPLNDISLLPPITSRNKSKGKKGMGDLHAIRILDTIMHDQTPKRSAVVFLQSETVLKFFDDPRTLAGLMGDWNRLPSSNRNTCFLVFSIPEINDPIISSFISLIPELSNILQTNKSGTQYQSGVFNIGSPEVDEISRLLESFVNENHIDLQDQDVDLLIRKMFAEGRQIREWKKLLHSVQELSLTSAIQHGWFPRTQPSLKSVWDLIDELIGLDSVKNRIKEISAWVQQMKSRGDLERKGDASPSLHMIFTGNPGTGKTTVARLFGMIFQEIGILSRGHLVEARAGDLIADYVGGTAIKTNQLVNRALDGVLFIDEAYSLVQDNRGNFGLEALETLLNRMEDDRHRLVVIAAGYPGLMEKFRQANPGLSRRFPVENIINFEDFNFQELWKIFQLYLSKKQISLDNKLSGVFENIIHELYLRKDIHFGNAGEIRNLVDAIDRRRSSRLINADNNDQLDLIFDDIPPSYRDLLPIANVSARTEFLTKLNNLIGLQEVKERLEGMVSLQEYEFQKNSLLNGQKQKLKFQHLVFSGNSGTGKTTVARLIGEFYKALGVLSHGHLVEVGRADLVAGYVGQTALQTTEKLKSALDGVLFIDEAYSLLQGGENDFAKEVVTTLVNFMETHQGRILIIVAGYPEEMSRFIVQNPGLLSRFAPTIHFKDFSEDELVHIFTNELDSQGLIINDQGIDKVRQFIVFSQAKNQHLFGNARFILNLVEMVKTNLARRVVPLLGSIPENEKISLLTTIEPGDIPESK